MNDMNHIDNSDDLQARLRALPAERLPPARVWQGIAAQLPAMPMPAPAPAAVTVTLPDTASADSRCTRPASTLMLPDTVSSATSPDAPPPAWIPPLTARRSSRGVCTCERIPPLTVVNAVSPLRPAAEMPPLTALACNRRTSTSATSMSALTVPSCTSTARGTRSSSVAPPLLRPRG